MMQPSLPPSPKTASSIYEAIKDGDWEGLLALYATTAYDAVHSEDFAHQGRVGTSAAGVGFHWYNSSPPSLAGDGPLRRGSFHEETKSEGPHHLTASALKNFKSSPSSVSLSSSSSVHELDTIVREIIGAELFDGHYGEERTPSSTSKEEKLEYNTSAQAAAGLPNKKTRQHSPLQRYSNPGRSDSSSRKMDWEKVMWDSASILSNSRPSPSFVATRRDRELRQDMAVGPFKSMEEDVKKSTAEDNASNNPIFEGIIAIATPGDQFDGGTGSGCAQHLACLLDSPFALTILIVLGVSVEARHTAFRRLAIHEAAAADSPQCLSLLMELGASFSTELFRDAPSSSLAATAASAFGDSMKWRLSSPSSAAASANTTPTALPDSFGSINESFSSESAEEERTRNYKKTGKKKLNIFSGWHKGKSMLKKSSDECDNLNTSFPVALKIIMDSIKLLRSGELNEMEASHYVLDQIKVSNRTMLILALQCPHLTTANMNATKDSVASQSSPFASIPTGLSSVNQLFQSNHRDMQSLFIKRNVDGHGNTPLHWAAFKNSVRAMDVLLSFNVDVNCRAQPSGWTPLHDAAYSDAADAVARLIESGATVDARSHSGATPLCFSAQEDAPNATRILLRAGADPSLRCLGNSPGVHVRANNADNNHFHSRFSGYTPLHYCAHYNAANAARVLLNENNHHRYLSAVDLLDIPDLNEKLPIHVAVARGSCLVLRELLHSGARVETTSHHPPPSARALALTAELGATETAPVLIPAANRNSATNEEEDNSNILSTSPPTITPVSSPLLKSMIPSQPISSSKPWNCLSQKSIDACKHLITEVEMNWTPTRHALFSPADRLAVVEVLRVGKRLETEAERGIFLDLWPYVLSFCGRGWFEPVVVDDVGMGSKAPAKDEKQGETSRDDEDISMSSSSSSSSSMDSSAEEEEEEEDDEFTQFQLEGTHAIL